MDNSQELKDAFIDGVVAFLIAKGWESLDCDELRGMTWAALARALRLKETSTLYKWRRGETNPRNLIRTILYLCQQKRSMRVAESVVDGYRGLDVRAIFDAGFGQAMIAARTLKGGFGKQNSATREVALAVRELRFLFQDPAWLIHRRTEQRDRVLRDSICALSPKASLLELDKLDRAWGDAWVTVQAAIVLGTTGNE